MASLIHALLTEDESVLLDGLDPAPGDTILALFARGNGDAALSLLQRAPAVIFVSDLFDQESLVAQLELKRWLFTRLDNVALREFLGLTDGPIAPDRALMIEEALDHLPPGCRAFWEARVKSLSAGMARTDSTSQWSRFLRRFIREYRKLATPLRGPVLRLGLLFAPLYFPREERRHSLGYRQLLAQPRPVLDRLMSKQEERPQSGYIPYEQFRYLLPAGHEAVREHLDRIVVLDHLPPPRACNRIYFSNTIDYFSRDGFQDLLSRVIPARNGEWRALINSTYASDDVHPHLKTGLREDLYRIDWERTRALRAQDSVGAYPGLTIIAGS